MARYAVRSRSVSSGVPAERGVDELDGGVPGAQPRRQLRADTLDPQPRAFGFGSGPALPGGVRDA
jgi:hypothetical protein